MKLVLIALAAAGAASSAMANESVEATPVAFEALAAGQNTAAIKQLTATDTSDAARLINLGTAYARTGKPLEAAAMYRAAAASPRYDLELADGSTMDSRMAARIALARLTAKMDTRYAAK